jgi:LysM repeat protein
MNRLKRPFTETQMPLIIAGGALAALIIVIVMFFSGGPDDADRLTRLENAVGALDSQVQEMERALSRVKQQDGVIETLIHKAALIDDASPERIEALEKQLANLQQQLTGTVKKPETPAETGAAAPEAGSQPAAADAKPPVKRPATPKARVDYHEVKAGETLYQISRQHKISLDQLRRLNNLEEGGLIRPGQKLVVSGKNR